MTQDDINETIARICRDTGPRLYVPGRTVEQAPRALGPNQIDWLAAKGWLDNRMVQGRLEREVQS